VALVACLSSCQTTEQYEAAVNADLDARLAAYNGATMAEFQTRTGMLPQDAYPIDGGRVFVFRTAPVYSTLPATNFTPAVTRSAQCQLLVKTVLDGRTGSADSWKIVGTQRSGACFNLAV
jgi:hypothetical protein